MLRPALAFLTLCAVAFLLAPTVQSVHEGVEGLNIHRDLPWQIWRWGHKEPPPGFAAPTCSPHHWQQNVTVTDWPAHIAKDQRFTLRGIDISPGQSGIGVEGIQVEIFLNETKEQPGHLLGTTTTARDGRFSLPAQVPHDMDARHYHIVAHALHTPKGCKDLYLEAWSDPEMNVTADTTLRFDVPPRVVIGHELDVAGTLVDVTGAPVRGANLTLLVNGKPVPIVTDEAGAFSHKMTPTTGGTLALNATYAGNDFYTGTSAATRVEVVLEDVEIQGKTIDFVRGQERTLEGKVTLAPGAKSGPVTLTFNGTRVATCATCAPTSSVLVTPDPQANGSFSIRLLVPSSEAHGPIGMNATGGGLRAAVPFNGTVRVPVTITLNATGDGLFHRTFHGEARALDDNGAPAPGPLAVETPAGWTNGTGTVAFSGSTTCGMRRATATYDANGDYMPTVQAREFGVCGFLATLPPWLLAMPWWVWPLALVALLGLWLLARRLFERYAPTLSRGPPLTIRFIEPDDGASEVVGVGDAVVAEVALDGALPPGHRLRVGTHRAMQDVAPEGLVATVPVVAEDLGDLPVRAEIVNEKGRVLTRRTATLHVVRYAEEIEARYRRLKEEQSADEAVSPREFESWLRAHDPNVDPRVAQNLVHLFEEADYSPREAGRKEFLAFLRAEKGVRRRDVA